jgi:hypothetical protein
MEDIAQPDVSVVLVNWNARDMLRACLLSLRKQEGRLRQEWIVVDNGSTDGSAAMLRTEWPEVLLIQPGRNIGYVRANNEGLRHARGRYVFFLNNDTVLDPHALRELVSFLDDRPRAGACSGLILNPDGTDQGCARRLPTVASGLFGRRSPLTRLWPNNPWSRRFMAGWQHEGNDPFEVEILSSAAILMPLPLALELNGMDEEFRLYWVDAELCTRIRRRGFQIWCVPRARITHFEGQGGSTRTFRSRMRSCVAFHRDAYLAFTKIHRWPWWHPGSLLAAGALAARAACLLAVQTLVPRRSTSSGMTTSPYRRDPA